MVFLCQKDSYLKKFQTSVLSCEPATCEVQIKNKKLEINGHEVILEDTIIFPEGGGQPDDRGLMNGHPILKVRRKGNQALHFTECSFAIGEPVTLELDWSRRFDHMQQHTAQHLITAVAEDQFHWCTTSWNLGDDISYIELNTPTIKSEEINDLENAVNDKIRGSTPVMIQFFPQNSPELTHVRTRLELPDDHSGPIRVIRIEGIDSNTCCGTHVNNLSHLQTIKLLYAEKGKKNKINLFFIAGERIFKYINKQVQREKGLISALNCGPEEHVEMAGRIQKTLKLTQKNLITVVRELAVVEAEKFNLQKERPPFHSYHRRLGDAEFMNIYANEVKDENIVLFITVGDERGAGQMLLSGPQELLPKLGKVLCEILDGKGAIKHGKFQGKVKNLTKRVKAEEIARQMTMEYIMSQ